MTDHPTTFRAEPADEAAFWEDGASIQRKDAGGLFDAMNALHRGTFAAMVAMFRAMPPEDRAGLVIEKAGDRSYEAEEILTLAERGDFPG
jgi:hypothetical protein